MPRTMVGVAVPADGICLRLLEVSSQHPVLIEQPSYVKELDGICRLFEGSLARQPKYIRDFEFLPIAVPLIEGLKYLRPAGKVVDSPQTDDAWAAGLRGTRKCKATNPQDEDDRWNYSSVTNVLIFLVLVPFV
jgi:hypothetical protein